MRRLLPLILLLAMPAFAEPPELVAFCYHDIRPRVAGNYDPDQHAVSTRNLINHFAWLRDNGYQPVSIDRILDARNGGQPLPDKAVLITFDDGLASIYTQVLPLLKLFDYPAVISLVTRWIESDVTVDYGGREIGPEGFLSWQQIRELQESGLVEIASHSHDMHKGVIGNPQGNEQPAMVTRVYRDGHYEDDAAYRARVRADLARSADLIEANTGKRPRVITWPYGAFNDTTSAIARDLGMPVSLTLHKETRERNGTLRIGRELIMANPPLDFFTAELLLEERPRIVRAAQIDLDYVYDPDPAQAKRNLDRLLDRIKELNISHVFLQAFADPDGDGAADALYFPNRHLPMRADLFNRVAWQLKTRSGVAVYAWLPLLSFTGDAFDEDWRVVQMRDGHRHVDPAGEPRLSPFSREARSRITEIYEDLAKHAHFAGLLFHDDGRMNEFEDYSDAALAEYRRMFGRDLTPTVIAKDPDLRARWTEFKTESLTAFSLQLADRVRAWQPGLKTARNLFASALLDGDAEHYLAQDFGDYLQAYDYVALMAMPGLEGAGDERQFFRRLISAAKARDPELTKTIFELQTKDWASGAKISSAELRATMRWLQAQGVRHLGYYPDDFIGGQPELGELREGISLARFPGDVEL